MASRKHRFFPLLPLLIILFSLHLVVSWGASEAQILLKFMNSLSNTSALANWSDNTVPCTGDRANWRGVICVNGSLLALQLENMGLSGKIDVETLRELPHLRTLSVKNNLFQGPLPHFKKHGALRAIYLTNNGFSGDIPGDSFEGMLKLKKLHLAGNEFTGAIPSSLASLPKLMELRLERNGFTGKIPYFEQRFVTFNVSDNDLEGPIPASLSKFDASSFSGNKGLCGEPLNQCQLSSSSSGKSKSSKPSIATTVIVAVVMVLAVAGILGAAVILLRRPRSCNSSLPVQSPSPSNFRKKAGFKESEHGGSSAESDPSSRNGKRSSDLSFVRDDRERFELADLLKASAEILGSGCFGSSYKAALPGGQQMVVKRFKKMNNVGKEEFQEHMRRLGRLTHPNILSLLAYHYRKEEKLLVSDFVHNGSLADRLHGQPGLDWPTRLKIVKGVAKGIAYLYKELPSIIAAHGHLKSSNVLLGESYEPLLCDYGLVPVINQEDAQELMVAYKSPEYSQHGRITKKTDVWCLGVLVLEVLTGKFPANFLQKGKGSEEEDLAAWVNSIPQDQWASTVFDKEMGPSSKGSEGEMLKLMKVGLSCCEGDVEKRLDLKEAVGKIDELN